MSVQEKRDAPSTKEKTSRRDPGKRDQRLQILAMSSGILTIDQNSADLGLEGVKVDVHAVHPLWISHCCCAARVYALTGKATAEVALGVCGANNKRIQGKISV